MDLRGTASRPSKRWQAHVVSASPLVHHHGEVFRLRLTLRIAVDPRAEDVVRSKPGKRAVDPAQRWEMQPLDYSQKRDDADSGVEIERTAGFYPERPAFVR
jgi:hypothetical protein